MKHLYLATSKKCIKKQRRILKGTVSAVLIGSICLSSGFTSSLAEEGEVEGRDQSLLVTVESLDDYQSYLSSLPSRHEPEHQISIDIDAFTPDSEAVHMDAHESGRSYLHTEDSSFVEWTIDVPEAGLYNLFIEYLPLDGKSGDSERVIRINGEIPFREAQFINFSRVWTNDIQEGSDPNSGISRDSRGNDNRPHQVEAPQFVSVYTTDNTGYYQEPLQYYFEEGENTLSFEAVSEPLGIAALSLEQYAKPLTYDEYINAHQSDGQEVASIDEAIKIQAEHAIYKSDSTLYPQHDRTSPKTEPYDPSKIRLNTIGGDNWRLSGQWIEWEIDVEEEGLYELAFKYRQKYSTGLPAKRKLLINGEVPFEEAKELDFAYDSSWRMMQPGADEPYLFYFEEGKNTLRLEVVLGEVMADALQTVDNSLLNLNLAYRELLMIIGTSPDSMRDYQLDTKAKATLIRLKEEQEVLEAVANNIRQNSDDAVSATLQALDNIIQQLDQMNKDSDLIPRLWSAFKDNIVSLGSWSFQMKEQALELDYFLLTKSEFDLPRADANIFQSLMHEIRSFIASFSEDYDSIGSIHEQDAITVWVLTSGAQITATSSGGRDQGNIVKDLVDNYFSPEYDIPVNIRLVDTAVLLSATLSGNGPDVAINLAAGEAINYAMRGAVEDLSQFDDFDETAEFFHPEALVPFMYQDGIYGLPQTMTFPVLFYRADILQELNLEVPNTWDDFNIALAEIQKNNLNVGVSTDPTTYAMYLYQHGGSLYQEGGMRSGLDTEEAILAFDTWVSNYMDFQMPVTYDFANRFRSGEMPLAIADYTNYSYLSVFAPEIRGLWGFTTVPGVVGEDGSIDRSVVAGETTSIMLSDSKMKDESWQFMKWWMSEGTQTNYGLETENVLGIAGRVATANIDALGQLPWSTLEYSNIQEQINFVRGMPEVPGGYFTTRHIRNAFYSVYNENENPRETMMDYTQTINMEISNKRKEFGLDYIEWADMRLSE